MAWLSHPAFKHPTALRLRDLLRSRVTLGVAYGVAVGLTVLAILLAVSPPATGPLKPITKVILTVLGLNLVLVLALLGTVALRFWVLMRATRDDAARRVTTSVCRAGCASSCGSS